jgi:hypothetical protein
MAILCAFSGSCSTNGHYGPAGDFEMYAPIQMLKLLKIIWDAIHGSERPSRTHPMPTQNRRLPLCAEVDPVMFGYHFLHQPSYRVSIER